MKMNPKYIPFFLGFTLAVGVVLGGYLQSSQRVEIVSISGSKAKLNKLVDFINNEYVDDINTDSIVDTTVDGIMSHLDPHSVYVSPQDQKEVEESMRGDFVGIGIHYFMFNDTLTVIRPLEGGPSDKAGLKAGDRILFADKVKLFGRKWPADSMSSRLKGKEGAPISLTVLRKSNHKKLNFTLKRASIPLKSIDVALVVAPKTGYVKINRFAEHTYDEFKTNLNTLKKSGIHTLIIDLRDNGGGYMEKAIEIADEFLKNNQLIVFTKDKNGTIENTFATNKGGFKTGRVFVLLDENSASASEILAGAIQDNDRGTIVGRRSFGKGLVQREMGFDDGSAVRLTIARYYTPTGRSIQKSFKDGNEAYFMESESRFLSGELYAKDSIKIADSLKFKTPKGRVLYGGGGIVPDVFVPISDASTDLNYVLQSGVAADFVFEILDKNRAYFESLGFDILMDKIENTDRYFNFFQSFVAKQSIFIDISKSKKAVNTQLKAEFARQLFGEKKYYEVMVKEDAMVKKIIQKMKFNRLKVLK